MAHKNYVFVVKDFAVGLNSLRYASNFLLHNLTNPSEKCPESIRITIVIYVFVWVFLIDEEWIFVTKEECRRKSTNKSD